MISVLVLFGPPADEAAFDSHFGELHMPLLRELPGLLSYRINRVAASSVEPAPYRLVLELEFASQPSMQDGLNSENGQAMARDYASFASGGVTILYCWSGDPMPE